QGDNGPTNPFSLIIAGDGLAYALYVTGWMGQHTAPNPWNNYSQYAVFQVSSSGASNNFTLKEFPQTINYDLSCHCWPLPPAAGGPRMITNADTGVLVAWYEWTGAEFALTLANVANGGVVLAGGPPVPHPSSQPSLSLELQAQDGSFIGWSWDDTGTIHSFSFDANGSLHWIAPNVFPAIATADGGFIGYDMGGSGALSFDQNGAATGQMPNLPTYSWKGAYQSGSIESMIPFFDIALIAQSHAAVSGGNLTGNGFSMVHHSFGLVFCGPTPGGSQGAYVWDG